jgi:uncharacterized membrane protein
MVTTRGAPEMTASTRLPPGPHSFGERMADRIAAFGGSWTFILLFLFALAVWTFGNTVLLGPRGTAFDPYPYVFLNLILSMVAALQAPVIMMSQNRATVSDRRSATIDYHVNVRAEREVRRLHEKLDALRDAQWAELVHMQHQQITLLTELLARYQPDSRFDAARPAVPQRDAADAGHE